MHKITVNRDYKPEPAKTEPATEAARFPFRNHLLTLTGVAAGMGLFFAVVPDNAGRVETPSPQATTVPVVTKEKQSDVTTVSVPARLPREETPDTDEDEFEHQPPGQPPGRWVEARVKRGDNLSRIFKRHGLSARQLQEILALGEDTRRVLKRLYPGDVLRLLIDDQGRLQRLIYDYRDTRTLEIQREPSGFQAWFVEHETERRLSYASGIINDSLFLTAQRAGLSDNVTMELAAIFGWDIDFSLDIREGDSFVVIYEEIYLDGEKLRDGAILAAEFVNRGKIHRAIRYTDPQGRADYFTPDGKRMRKAFLRSPVAFTRVSSRFSLGRRHPILNKIRAHKGVDYAAPRGTPVKATGDGKVLFRGTKGGYGRTVILQHGGRYQTLYAHLSRYARGLRPGKRVRQGQVIGYVGSSGLATGPHLHYEFRVNGVHRNPLTVKLPDAAPLPRKYLPSFKAEAAPLLAQLDVLRRSTLALNEERE